MTNADLKGAPSVHPSNLAAKSDLATLKILVNKIDVDKLKTVPADLSMLSNVEDNDVVKKLCMINDINTKIPSTNGLVSKIEYDSDKQKLEKKRLRILIRRHLILTKYQHKNNRNQK